MYEMAKKAREAMRGKAKRLSGEKDSKTDSSNWTPAAPLNADVKTGMRPISKQGYKKGGKVEGMKADCHAGRKPRKAGGRAITADSLINRDQKEANESREGKKHIGGLKSGGRAGKALGGSPTDSLKNSMNPQAYIRNVLGPTMGMKKGGKAKKNAGGGMADYDTGSRTGAGAVTEDKSPAKAAPTPPRRPDYDTGSRTGAGAVTRSGRKAGGNVNYGPAENVGGKPGVSMKEQIAIEKREQAASKPTRGKAKNYADGGMAPYGGTAPVPAVGPDPRSIVQKNAMDFGMGTSGSPYKKGGMAKFEGSAKDEAQDKKLAKKHGMSMKAWEASKMDTKHDTQQSMKGLKKGGRTGRAEGGKSPSPADLKARYAAGAARAAAMAPGEQRKETMDAVEKKANYSRLDEMARKTGGRTAKFGGGALSDGPKKGSKGKGKTNINIVINPGKPDDQMVGGMPPMPPGLPPRPAGGIPVPMGMPPAGAAAPMPMPMPMPGPAGPAGPAGLPAMGRKAGGKVYKSYKDMDAGAGSGLGRLEKTEIAKRKA